MLRTRQAVSKAQPLTYPWTWLLEKDLEINLHYVSGYDTLPVTRVMSYNPAPQKIDNCNNNGVTFTATKNEYREQDVAAMMITEDSTPSYTSPTSCNNGDKKNDFQLPKVKVVAKIHVDGKSLYKALVIIVHQFTNTYKREDICQIYTPTVEIEMKDFLFVQQADKDGFICYEDNKQMLENLSKNVTWDATISTCSFLQDTVLAWERFLVTRLSEIIPSTWVPVNMGPKYAIAYKWYTQTFAKKSYNQAIHDSVDIDSLERMYARYVLQNNKK